MHIVFFGTCHEKNKLESCSGKKRYVNVTQVNDFDVIGILSDGSVCI